MTKRFVVLAVSGLVTAIGMSACGKRTEMTLNLVGHSSTSSSSLSRLVSAGDQISIREQLTRDGQPYGSDNGRCIADTNATAICTRTLNLPGGTVVLQGRVKVSAPASSLHVGEGTGKYLRTSGFAEVATSQGNETRLAVHLKS